MRRQTVRIDAAIALGLAILLIIISPGLAIVGIVALLLLLVCAASFLLDHRWHLRHGTAFPRRRSHRRARLSEPPGRRNPGSRD